jgi:hypothetical protein
MEGSRGIKILKMGFCLGALISSPLKAKCFSLTSGAVVYDVTSCKAINPEQAFDFSKEKFSWIKDLDPAGKKELLNSYRGLLLKGQVVKSKAVQSGLTKDKGALEGDSPYFYLPPGGLTCATVSGRRLAGNVKEVCCDGGGYIPCLLGTSYLFVQASVVGNAGSSDGDLSRQKARKSKDYAQGEAAFARRHYKEAVKAYEKARASGELDVKGHYKLGYAYRELDQCGDATTVLKYIYEKQNKKQIWADEEKIARAGIMLLARCYAKLNDPDNTMFILNGYLLEPQKYRSEIKESLSHKDFGWIHTSKEYRNYKAEAQKKLR